MKAEQTVLARITPAGMVLAPAVMLGMAGVLWLVPFMYGSYERFFAESRRAAGWPVVVSILTLLAVGLVVAFTFQRFRHGRAIVILGPETVTLVGMSARTLLLKDVTAATIVESGRMFEVETAQGERVTLGAGFWDARPATVAEQLMVAALRHVESRTVPIEAIDEAREKGLNRRSP